jgi:WD40 repeat protein
MCRKKTFRASAGFLFIAFAFALPSMGVDFSQEPTRLGGGQAFTLAFSPDGTVLAVWYNSERAVLLWDVQTQQQVGRLEGDLVWTGSIVFSPDGRLLAFGCEDNTIRLWDVAAQNQVGMMQSPTRWGVMSVAFSPDGKTLASSGSGDNVVRLWDVQTLEQVAALRGHTGQIAGCVAFSPDGRLLFSGGLREDEAIRVWDVQTKEQVGELIGHLDVTYDLAFSPDGTILASAGGAYDKAVYLWDVQAQNQVGVLGGHSAHVCSIAFSPDGKLLALWVNWEDTIHLWDVEGQERMGVFTGHDASVEGWICKIAFSSDGKWLACGSENGVELWELNLPGAAPRTSTFGPKPYNGTLLMDTWVSLDWIAGDSAVSHDVYIGDNFDDVSEATQDSDVFRGNQTATFYVAGLPGFAYPDGLVPGTTYYWRVDEVNDADPNSPWKGSVWSFTIQPKIAFDPVPADGAESVDLNVEFSWTAGLGAALHTVYFGDNFDDVNNATEGLGQSSTTYMPGPLEFGKTYYWRVDELTGGRGAEMHKGDIWSFTTEGAAEDPNPADGAVDVKPTQILSWGAGAVAASHEVYFGIDADAVRNATKTSAEYKGTRVLGDESYDLGLLALETTYYWRIDEVNGVHPHSPWLCNVWSFTTGNFIVVDDFEEYDANSNKIWYAWHDGLGAGAPGIEPYIPGNGTGSAVGDETTPSHCEETIVHGGRQSMPIFYDNNQQGMLKYSEAEMTLSDLRNWTVEGVGVLTIWFHGAASNGAEPLYVALNGKTVVTHDNPNAAQIETWTQWNIDLQVFADMGVDLTNVDTIGLGFGDRNNPQPGGSGVMFFDDIRLVRPTLPPELEP